MNCDDLTSGLPGDDGTVESSRRVVTLLEEFRDEVDNKERLVMDGCVACRFLAVEKLRVDRGVVERVESLLNELSDVGLDEE